MAVITVPDTLDVLEKFECLMKESVSSESVYIRTKETINQFFKESSLNSADKTNALTTVLGSMSTSITAAAMQAAIQWASAERDLALRKLQLAKELDAIDADTIIKEAQAEKLYYDSIAVQAETIRMMGTPTVVNKKVLSLAPEGKFWQDIKVGEQQESNMVKESLILDSKLNESFAAIHKTVADTVVNFGAWQYDLSSGGINTRPTKTPNAVVPLSDIQRVIAIEQAKGYSYNAWANGVTSSAGMLGTMMASDLAPDPTIINTFKDILLSLKNVNLPVIPVV